MNMPSGDQNPSFHDSILEKPATALEERQQLLAHHVRLVARRMNHPLFVFGAQGGLGKRRTILRTMDEEGVEPILINSHITPLALYTTLFRFRGEEVIFLVQPAEAYCGLKKYGHADPICCSCKHFRQEKAACPQACCTMRSECGTTVT